MIFQEPKAEFVPIDFNESILTSSATPCVGSHESGGVVVCTGSVSPANPACPDCVNDSVKNWETNEWCD